MNKEKIISDVLKGGIKGIGKFSRKSEIICQPATADFDKLKKEPAENFNVGFGKCEIITPQNVRKKKYYVAGYGENNPATGMLDPQIAHALWLDDNSGRGGVLFISIDCVGMMNKDVLGIRGRLKGFCDRTGCRSINICATHDHAGIDTMGIWGPLPKTGIDDEFMDTLYNSVIKACEDAYNDARISDIYYGQIEVPDMQEDIRLPIVYSKTLHRFRVVPKDGSREIYFLNFASHSESLSGDNSLISADFPCYLRREIMAKTGAETIYFVGAIGGMISMEVHGQNMGQRIDDTKALGVKLAGYAMSIAEEEKLDAVVNCMRQEFFFDAENTVLMLAGLAKILRVNKYPAKNSTFGWMLKSEMSYFEIGSKKLLLLPCELFPELAYGGYLDSEHSAEGKPETDNPVPLCEMYGEDLIIFGLANDEVGYVLPPNDFMLNPDQPYMEKVVDRLGRRHYEETNSLGPNTAVTIADTFSRMLKKIK